MGKDRLGLSCGLLGTGMVFARPLLDGRRFDPTTLAEDSYFHQGLVWAGERVHFAHEAAVASPMPSSRGAIDVQQRRWEGGRVRLIRDWTAPLLRGGLRRGDPVRVHAALEHFVPPQSVLAPAHALAAATTLVGSSPPGRRLALLNGAMHVVFVLGGLRLAGVPRSVYAGLLGAPALVGRKLRLLAGLGVQGAPRDWERTSRE
jgi:hypothetical protein